MADLIIVVRDAALAPQVVGWPADRAAFFLELLSPLALLAQIGPVERAPDPLALTAACAAFDGDTGVLTLRLPPELELGPGAREAARALLAGVWAPARVELAGDACADLVDAPGIKAVLDAFAGDDEAAFHRGVALALHARGFGELPVGRAFRPPDDEVELVLCTMAFALRAARAGEHGQ